jgi:hypothetical protein
MYKASMLDELNQIPLLDYKLTLSKYDTKSTKFGLQDIGVGIYTLLITARTLFCVNGFQ